MNVTQEDRDLSTSRYQDTQDDEKKAEDIVYVMQPEDRRETNRERERERGGREGLVMLLAV